MKGHDRNSSLAKFQNVSIKSYLHYDCKTSNIAKIPYKYLYFKPFKPHYPNTDSPHCSLYILYGISWENLLKHQDVHVVDRWRLVTTSCHVPVKTRLPDLQYWYFLRH